MSENPYQSSPGGPDSVSVAAQQKPIGLTAVPVICLILGVLGVLGGMFGVVALFFQDSVNELQGLQTDPGIVEFQNKMQDFQRTLFIPNLITSGSNLIAGALLVLGSIGVFGLKEGKRRLLRNALLFATIFAILRGCYLAWVQFQSVGMITGITPQGANAAAAATFEMAMKGGLIATMVIWLAWAVVLAGFYLWGRSYLNKPSVISFFNASGK